MEKHNTVHAIFASGAKTAEIIDDVWQHDFGQTLQIEGLSLPPTIEVHYANKGRDTAIPQVGVTKDGITTAPIPNEILNEKGAFTAYIFVTNGESGETCYTINGYVNKRPPVKGFNAPEDQEILHAAVGAVNAAAERAESAETKATEAAKKTAEDAEQTAADRAEVERLVESVSGIGEQVTKVENLTKQAQTSATNAALSEQAAKTAETNAQTAQAGAEAAEGNAELAERNAKASEQAVEKAKQLVTQMGQEVLDNKNHVDQTVQAFDQTAQQAVADVNNAGQTQTERVQSAGNTATESVKTEQGKATQAIETAKTEAVKAVQAEGTTQTENVTAEGAKQVQAVQAAAQEIVADREQIAQNKADITTLKEDLDGLIIQKIKYMSKLVYASAALDSYTHKSVEFTKNNDVLFSWHRTENVYIGVSTRVGTFEEVTPLKYGARFYNPTNKHISFEVLMTNRGDNWIVPLHATKLTDMELEPYEKKAIKFNGADANKITGDKSNIWLTIKITSTYDINNDSSLLFCLHKANGNEFGGTINVEHAINAEYSEYAVNAEHAKKAKDSINSGLIYVSSSSNAKLRMCSNNEIQISEEDFSYTHVLKKKQIINTGYQGVYVRVPFKSIEELDGVWKLELNNHTSTGFENHYILDGLIDWGESIAVMPRNTECNLRELFERSNQHVKIDNVKKQGYFYVTVLSYSRNPNTFDKPVDFTFRISHKKKYKPLVIATEFDGFNPGDYYTKTEIDKKINTNGNYIVCWGDSLTAGGGWTKTLENLSGMPVYNGGTGGENARTIVARQGADIMMIDGITIPATTDPVTIATRADDTGITTSEGYKVTPLLQGGAHVNPVKIGDVEGTLKWTGSNYADASGTWTFTRNAIGDTVVIDRPTAMRTEFDRNKNAPHLMVIFIGQNGGYADNADLIRQHRLMIEHAHAKNFVVLGLSSGSEVQRKEYENAMKKEFGRYFISLREYLSHPIYKNGEIVSCYGLADQNLNVDPSYSYNGKTTLQEIKEGAVPHQILADGVHYTNGTKTVIGNMLYRKCCELGIF